MVTHSIIMRPYKDYPRAYIAKHDNNTFESYSDPGHDTSTVTMEVISDISKAINGEYDAIHCYEFLIYQTANSEMRKQIIEIRKDEIRHYQTFYNLYLTLTNTYPQVTLSKQCPPNVKSGTVAAFTDEQETVDFYHEIARKTNDPHIQEAFLQAALDEQNHAVWFLYFMKDL